MAERDDDAKTGFTIAAWHAWREDDEQAAKDLGAALARLLPPGRWRELDEDERRTALEAAERVMHERMSLARATSIAWEDSDDPGLGYDERTGAIHVPEQHLGAEGVEPILGGLAEEVRHAWQFDVIEGRLQHPLGEPGKKRLADAYRVYKADDIVRYTSSELENDAKDFAADVVAGYRARREK